MHARNRHAAHSRDRWPRRLRGFTLVEMLIAMVLTLIMVWAIAEFYARVGEAVKDNRAMIEQRGGLRSATQLLIADLTRHTVVPAPPVHDEVTPVPGTTLLLSTIGAGYLVIFEGTCSDADPDGDMVIDADSDGEPDLAELGANQAPLFIETTLVPNLLGENDDYIGLTIRSADEPFVAPRVRSAVVGDTGILDVTATGAPVTASDTSLLAEVAWWTSFTDDPLLPSPPGPPPNLWNPGEPRTLHRRLLLVRPELNVVHAGDTDYNGPYYFRVDPTVFDYYTIMQFGDVSIRPFTVSGSSYV
jgi:prepilin-type N-terminal cleavage/methylation domain-containing protein